MLVLTLGDAILLGSVKASHMMMNAMVCDLARKTVVLATPIRLRSVNFGIKKMLDMLLK
jgi:hypothetical protein